MADLLPISKALICMSISGMHFAFSIQLQTNAIIYRWNEYVCSVGYRQAYEMVEKIRLVCSPRRCMCVKTVHCQQIIDQISTATISLMLCSHW